MLEGPGLSQEQCALAEVVEDQRGQHQAEPGETDRGAAEVAHVGVERFRPGDSEHDGAQGDKGLPTVVPEQADGVAGVKRREHARALDDLSEPEQAQGGEPGQHHRSEQPAHAGRAAALEEEKPKEHQDGKRHDVGLEPGRSGLQALDGGEYRDRRGDQTVAVEQSQPAQREDEDKLLQVAALGRRSPGRRGCPEPAPRPRRGYRHAG